MSTPPGAPSSSWVHELVRTKRAAIPWDLAVLTAIAVTVPVGISLLLMSGDAAILGLGVLTSIGALVASIADRGGPAVDRVRRIVANAVAGAIGMAVGALVLGNEPATVIVIVVASLLSGIAGVVSGLVSGAALQFLVYSIVGSGIDFGLRPLWLAPLILLVGAAWRFGLTWIDIAVGSGRRRAPERMAVAAVYSSLAAHLDALGTAESEAARRDVTTALNQAYDLMITTRTSLAGRDPRWRRIVTLLNATTPLVEAVTTVVVEGDPLPAEVPNALRAIARSIEDPHAPPPTLPPPDRSTPGRAALSSALRVVGSLLDGDDPATTTVPIQRPDAVGLPRPSARDRVAGLRDHLLGGGETWFAVLRLVVCVAIAQAASVLLPLERPYWITLTVAVVMKPDFGSVFARAVQRGLGTAMGVLLGAAVVALLPGGWSQMLALAVFAAGMPIAIRRNYGLFATFITPVIVILLELAHGGDPGIIVSRVLDTLIGCAIVLVFGYLPWPSTWRSARELGDRVAQVTSDVAEYLSVALGPNAADVVAAVAARDGDDETDPATKPAREENDDRIVEQARSRSSARRGTYRSLSDLRTRVQQTLAEPPPVSTAAAAWWPQIVSLERVTDAITSTAIRAAQSGAQPDQHDVELLHAALTELSDAIRERRPPETLDLPDDALLNSVADEVGAARAVLAA